MYKLMIAAGAALVAGFLLLPGPAKAMPTINVPAAAVELGTGVEDVGWRRRRYHRRYWRRPYAWRYRWAPRAYVYAPAYASYGYGWYSRRYWGWRRGWRRGWWW